MKVPQTITAEHALRPSIAVPVLDHPEITVALDRPPWRDEKSGQVLMRFRYYGWPGELIAAGVLTAEILEPAQRHRRDADGFPVSVERYWRLRDGEPQRYCKVRRSAPAQSIHQLPGTEEAIEAAQRYSEWQEKWWVEQHGREPARVARPCVLRLVVDNTKPPAGAHG